MGKNILGFCQENHVMLTSKLAYKIKSALQHLMHLKFMSQMYKLCFSGYF